MLLLPTMLYCFLSLQYQDSVDIQEYVVGTWQWIETRISSGAGESINNPANCNCTKTLELTADGKISLYEDGILVLSDNYAIKAVKFMDDPLRFDFHSVILNGQIIKLQENGLGIGAFGACGNIHYYKKILTNN